MPLFCSILNSVKNTHMIIAIGHHCECHQYTIYGSSNVLTLYAFELNGCCFSAQISSVYFIFRVRLSVSCSVVSIVTHLMYTSCTVRGVAWNWRCLTILNHRLCFLESEFKCQVQCLTNMKCNTQTCLCFLWKPYSRVFLLIPKNSLKQQRLSIMTLHGSSMITMTGLLPFFTLAV